MPAPSRRDPYKNFRFDVDIDGTRAGFASVSGLAAEAEVIEYRQGSDGFTSSRKLPGRVKYPNVTLRRGVTTDHFLWDWWKTILAGLVQRRNVQIILLDDDRNEVLRWLLSEAWIAKIEVSDLDAEGNEVAIESIELAHEGLELIE